jgi:ribosomal protein L34E
MLALMPNETEKTPSIGEQPMQEATETLHCADCGRIGDASSIMRHIGAVSARGNEGRVHRTYVALCPACADARLEVQESALL